MRVDRRIRRDLRMRDERAEPQSLAGRLDSTQRFDSVDRDERLG